MALSLEQKRTIAELTGLGIITHQVADMMLKGALTKVETNAAIAVLKKVGRVAGRGLARAPATVGMLALRHPYIATGAVVYVAYQNREEIENLLDRGYEIMTDPSFGQPTQPRREGFQPFRPGPAMVTIPPAVTKRAVSTANKAVRQGMKWLKAGTKAATGAKPGKLPKGAFKTVVKAAGLANPKTKSRIGKGKTIMNKLARRLKKWW
jgi:hypothetical protein